MGHQFHYMGYGSLGVCIGFLVLVSHFVNLSSSSSVLHSTSLSLSLLYQCFLLRIPLHCNGTLLKSSGPTSIVLHTWQIYHLDVAFSFHCKISPSCYKCLRLLEDDGQKERSLLHSEDIKTLMEEFIPYLGSSHTHVTFF